VRRSTKNVNQNSHNQSRHSVRRAQQLDTGLADTEIGGGRRIGYDRLVAEHRTLEDQKISIRAMGRTSHST
jgi:hypothetical protein